MNRTEKQLKNRNGWAQISPALLFAFAMSITLESAAARHLCAIDKNDYLNRASKDELTQKLCSSLLMARIAQEEASFIDSRLSSEDTSDAYRKKWPDLMARGMYVLAERNLCVESAKKVQDAYLSRFRRQPRCDTPATRSATSPKAK